MPAAHGVRPTHRARTAGPAWLPVCQPSSGFHRPTAIWPPTQPCLRCASSRICPARSHKRPDRAFPASRSSVRTPATSLSALNKTRPAPLAKAAALPARRTSRTIHSSSHRHGDQVRPHRLKLRQGHELQAKLARCRVTAAHPATSQPDLAIIGSLVKTPASASLRLQRATGRPAPSPADAATSLCNGLSYASSAITFTPYHFVKNSS